MKTISRESLGITQTGMNNHRAKAVIAEAAMKQHETIYRYARTVGQPEVDAVSESTFPSRWLKAGKFRRAPDEVSFSIDAAEYWGFYLKGFATLQALVAYDPTEDRHEVVFFLHGEPDA